MSGCCALVLIHSLVLLRQPLMPPSRCMEALGPETDSRHQSWRRGEPGRQHRKISCPGSATRVPLAPSTTLHNRAADQVHCQLGLVGICPLGHVHGRGPQGVLGLHFVSHWHLALPRLLLRDAHHLSHSSHLLHSWYPWYPPPPLLWLQAGLVHPFQYIDGFLL